MADILQHLHGVSDRHQQVVHLVKPVAIVDDDLEKRLVVFSLPVQKSASGSLAHLVLPAADVFKDLILDLQVDKLGLCKDDALCTDQVEAVPHNSLANGVITSFVALENSHDQL